MLPSKLKGNRLFWKITAGFTAVLILLGVVFVMIASHFSKTYYTEAYQILYGDLAGHLATFTKPFKDSKPSTNIAKIVEVTVEVIY